MTDKSEAQLREEIDAFHALMQANMPEAMTTEDIIQFCGGMITDYSSSFADAKRTVMLMARLLEDFYIGEPNDECACPQCTEKRKAKAN